MVLSCSSSSALTEITVGSSLLQSHLFDGYLDRSQSLERDYALVFALSVTRKPCAGIVTCQSGGFIASGSCGPEKSPVVVDPEGLKALPGEGWGEVQTPFRVPERGDPIPLGSLVFCRPAKAGEIAERFNHYYIWDETQRSLERKFTYRGYGYGFF